MRNKLYFLTLFRCLHCKVWVSLNLKSSRSHWRAGETQWKSKIDIRFQNNFGTLNSIIRSNQVHKFQKKNLIKFKVFYLYDFIFEKKIQNSENYLNATVIWKLAKKITVLWLVLNRFEYQMISIVIKNYSWNFYS